MIPARYAYHYPNDGRPGVQQGRTPIDPRLLLPTDPRLQRMAEVPGDRPSWAQDLLQIARAVYLADKLSLRANADDGWTRWIDLSVQVVETERWTDQVLALLARLAETLTADRWTISVRPGAFPWPHQGRVVAASPVEEVALFSGGLDSTAHAVERSDASLGDLLLVTYYEPHWGGGQDDVLDAIRRAAGREIRQFKASQQVRLRGRKLEKSARSRGLLYTATAVCLAAAHGVPRVAVPENGQLALNPALTSARSPPARPARCTPTL